MVHSGPKCPRVPSGPRYPRVPSDPRYPKVLSKVFKRYLVAPGIGRVICGPDVSWAMVIVHPVSPGIYK